MGELLGTSVVGRKTPLDGRIEITAAAARRLEALRGGFTVLALGRRSVGRIDTIACACGKGGDASGDAHVHRFAASELFRGLGAGTTVRLELDEAAGTLRVEPASPPPPGPR